MTYAQRRILDADAHVMEPAGWLESYVDPSVRDRIPPMDGGDAGFSELLLQGQDLLELRWRDEAEARAARSELLTMPRKGWLSFGGIDPAERSVALDELGFELQVVYPTGSFPQIVASPANVQLAAAIGMNRGLAEFCESDGRLVPTAYVPLHHGLEAALRVLEDAVGRGTRVVMVDMVPAKGGVAPSHPDHDRVWAAIVDADLLLSTHIGLDNGWRPLRPEYFDNGRTLEHFRSDAPGDALSYMAIGYPAELFLSSMVLDGVLERFPALRISVAELGAVWVPGFLHHLDQAARAFRRLQDLSHLSLAPSEYIARQVRFTPFAGEPVGWMMDASSPALYCFSSDYPHHEGSDDPVRRFDQTMTGASADAKDAFYAENFAALLGASV
ncbi:MAG TPA: amidohydrolase family protein [Acidimicrobiales bacterium]|nr:amidohydrolase family protein [Acidimicrobiales bacterium]